MSKNISSSYSSHGQPFLSPLHLDHLQAAIKDNAAAIMRSLIDNYDATKVYILYGLVTSTGGGGSTDYSAGAVFCNGEIFLSPAQTLSSAVIPNVPVASISTDYADGSGQTSFADSFVQKICAYRNVTLSNAASGSGNLNGGASANNDFSAFLRLGANQQTAMSTHTGNALTVSFDTNSFHKLAVSTTSDVNITLSATNRRVGSLVVIHIIPSGSGNNLNFITGGTALVSGPSGANAAAELIQVEIRYAGGNTYFVAIIQKYT